MDLEASTEYAIDTDAPTTQKDSKSLLNKCFLDIVEIMLLADHRDQQREKTSASAGPFNLSRIVKLSL